MHRKNVVIITLKNVQQNLLVFLGAKSAVLNFGTTTNWFDLARSCRQGDPIAPYLFILVMEALLCQIRKLDIGLNLSNQLDTEKF
jgi:hypothetical protein